MQKKLIKVKGKYVCPYCKEPLEDGDLKYSQVGEQTYNLYLTSHDLLSLEEDEFFPDDSGDFYCNHCGQTLFPYDEELAIKILKAQAKTSSKKK